MERKKVMKKCIELKVVTSEKHLSLIENINNFQITDPKVIFKFDLYLTNNLIKFKHINIWKNMVDSLKGHKR